MFHTLKFWNKYDTQKRNKPGPFKYCIFDNIRVVLYNKQRFRKLKIQILRILTWK